MSSDAATAPRWHLDRDGPTAVLRLSGDWLARTTGVRGAREVRQLLDDAGGRALRIEAGGLGRWDSALIGFVRSLHAGAGIAQIDDTDLPAPALRLLALATAGRAAPAEPGDPPTSSAAALGRAFRNAAVETEAIATLVGETVLRGVPALAGRTHARATDVVQLVREAGAGALGIVGVVNALVGAILAFVGAVQLQRFGAGIYVANLVGIAVVREMAAMVTAIVMAGRTGGAYAAHLATMQGNEEVDALTVLGIRVFDFLVLPRVAALVTMMPLLYLYGCAVGILGGFVVSVATLDLAPASFIEQLRGGVAIRQFEIGLVKSMAFGALVALAGCRIGLSAGRSAAAVGRAATAAVVSGIVGVIALDAVFALCTNALGI